MMRLPEMLRAIGFSYPSLLLWGEDSQSEFPFGESLPTAVEPRANEVREREAPGRQQFGDGGVERLTGRLKYTDRLQDSYSYAIMSYLRGLPQGKASANASGSKRTHLSLIYCSDLSIVLRTLRDCLPLHCCWLKNKNRRRCCSAFRPGRTLWCAIHTHGTTTL